MDGIHDLGGRLGFGSVHATPAEPVFTEPWEATARGLVYAVGAASKVSGSEFRHSIERMDPAQYLSTSYYEHWLTAAATLAVEHGLVTAAELEERAGGAFPLSRPVRTAAVVDPGVDVREPRFAVGERVRVRDVRPLGHTRCPWYVRGRTGVVVRHDGVFSIPDVEAHSATRRREPTYSVRFAAVDLWEGAEPDVVVHVDLWDSYLEPA